MELENILERIISKVDRNIDCIGSDLREFTAQPDGDYFKGSREGYIGIGHIFSWTESFFTGMAYWSYRVSNDSKYVKWIYQFYDEYYKKVFVTSLDTMHDLGFLYTPYAVAMYKLTGDSNMMKLGVKAADELSKRFIPAGGYIRAWGRVDDCIPAYVSEALARNHFFTESKGVAIIDCMMNLPLLFWASEVTGNPYYEQVAKMHADTTLKHFVRDDYSVCHAFRFDVETGMPIGEENYCGYAKGSHWARGASWAIYGFAVAYAYTKEKKYLNTAIKICKKFIVLCEEDGIPVWDFKLPEDQPALYCGDYKDGFDWDVSNEVNTRYNRDTSAAAITVCAIQQILQFQFDEVLETYMDKTLESLISCYMDYSLDVPGVLRCQNGRMSYCSFGDYFFMEAIINQLYDFGRIW